MNISFKALGIGYLITVGAGILGSFLNLIFLSSTISDSFSDSNIQIQLYLSYFIFGITLLFYILSGYICAKIAQKDELLHGILLGLITWVISSLVTYIMYGFYDQHQPALSIQTFFTLVWPVSFCMLGAFIRKRINDKIQEENDPSLEQKIKNLGNN